MAAFKKGDPRPAGAGRKKGSTNKANLAREAEVKATGITPLDYMLRVMRDPNADEERRDKMAAAAAPYVHPKLTTVEANVNITGHEAALALLK